MADTLSRIVGPTLLSNAASTVYTCPAATTVGLRSIHAANVTGSAATFFLSIGADGTGTRFCPGISIPANSSYDWSGLEAIAAAEILQAYSGTNNAICLTITGILIT